MAAVAAQPGGQASCTSAARCFSPVSNAGISPKVMHGDEGAARASTRASTEGSTRVSTGKHSLEVPEPVEPQKRRWEIWCGWAVATLSAGLASCLLSGGTCSADELSLGLDIGQPFAHKAEVFFLWQPLTLFGPWASASLLACFVDHRGRFCSSSPLHVWARRWAVISTVSIFPTLLTIPLGCAGDRDVRYAGVVIFFVSGLVCWPVMHLITYWMAVLKLRALGQVGAARVCCWMLGILFVDCLAFMLWFFLAVGDVESFLDSPAGVVISLSGLLCFLALLAIVTRGMLRAARMAEHESPHARLPGCTSDAPQAPGEMEDASMRSFRESARLHRAITWTRTTAYVTMASGVVTLVISCQWLFGYVVDPLTHLRLMGWLQVADHILNCAQTAFLSGIVGADPLQRSSESFMRVGRHSGFALREARRITFGGRVSTRSDRCVASFPGMYADLWARVTSIRSQQASVACVFLADKSAGLGEHVKDPDNPQHACYCKTIYPTFPAAAYLRTLPKPGADADMQEYRRKLAFEKADADAMGVYLLVEDDYPSFLWGRAQSRGLQKARRLCDRNGARAPWGCIWFAKWVENVEKAAAHGQELLVFYKEGKVGMGKLPWRHLCDPESINSVTGSSGLGASQRVEVAYLDRKGYSYTELDVMDLENAMPALG